MKSERRGRYSDETRAELNKNFTRGTTLSTFHSVEREESDRQKERNLRSRRRKLSGVLLIIVLVCGLGLMTLTQFSGSFVDVTSNVQTLETANADRYKNIVSEYLSKNPFERFSFARRNNNLLGYVAEQAPEVKSIKISQAGLLLGKLRVEFREPVAMWRTANETSYVDAEGVVFSNNYFATPSVTITDNSGAVAVSDVVASSRFLGFVGRVTAGLAENGGAVERVIIPTGAIRYVEFYLADRKYPFKAQIDRDPVGQAADIAAMTKYLDNNGITPTSYVDTRIAGKGYWK
ncbi:hypothetical protein FWD20_01000 [Candidatus Saccharibacteria bacterium]|nr:hypothetical protein [Candidatus Saccharibacteria bacterium]